MEYDYTSYASSAGTSYAGANDWTLLRQLSQRREYLHSTDTTPSRVTTYSGQTVSDYDGNGHLLSKVVHTINPVTFTPPVNPTDYNDWREGQETQTQYYDSDGATLLQQINRTFQQRSCTGDPTCWWLTQAPGGGTPSHDPQLTGEQTTQGATVKNVTYAFDANNNKTDEYDYDWGIGAPGALLRHINITFNTASNFLAQNIVDLPSEAKLFDGSNVQLSDTQYGYDAGNVSPASGIVGHDNTNYAGNATRGNRTSESSCLNIGSCTWLTTTYGYDIAGSVVSVTDPLNHTTSASRNDPQNTYANVTTLTNFIGQVTTAQYDYNTGKLTLCTDVNAVQTAYSYSDPLNRLTQIRKAAGLTGVETHTNVSYVSPIETDIYNDQITINDENLRTQNSFDGWGRLSGTNTYVKGSSSCAYVATTKSYDALGRLLTTTNPSCPGDGLGYTTTYGYDALGRTTSVTTADGAVATSRYSNNQTTLTDQAGVSRTNTNDGLGRLASVVDATGTTLYGYDAMDDLQCVKQGVNPGAQAPCVTPAAQTRSFTYDSLKRLVTAANPESGTISYTYDNNGNLKTKTDNRGIVTTSYYDALNRLYSKTYSDGATPSVSYSYGDSGSIAYGKGRLTQVTNGSSATNYTSYDPLGRVLSSSQVTAGQTYSFAYQYNLAGSLTSEIYPSGRTVGTCYDGANRTSAVVMGSCQAATKNYVTGVVYWPHGAPYYYTLGNNFWPVYHYNSRLQMDQYWGAVNNSPNQFLYHNYLNWGGTNNNGNLYGVTEGEGGPSQQTAFPYNFTQWFTYDTANRLQTAKDSGGWSRTFGYDQYGNMWVGGSSGIGLSPATATSNIYNAATNRKNNESYDAAGNELTMGGIYTFAYDAENRIVSEGNNIGNPAAQYVYDGEGRRVQKTSGAATTVYVYDAAGQLSAEYTNNTATAPPCQTCYLTYDHLGSTRMVTDQIARVISFHDYLPFGEEVMGNTVGRSSLFGPGADGVNQKFTGKERDSESGLDYFGARYYGSALGRFTSPDEPLADQYEDDPQSWNLYSYGRNNPLRNVDPTGNACIYSGSGNINDSSNYSDDNSGGQSCSEAFSPQQNNTPSTTVTAQQGSWLTAVGTNAFLSVSNAANSFFSFIAPNSQLLSQTPTGQGTAAQIGNGIGFAATLIGPGGEENAAAKTIKISGQRLMKVLGMHTGGLAAKSFFHDATEVPGLIRAAESAAEVPSVGGRFTRTVDAGRTIGTDITTGQPTSVYTVVTDANGNLVTAFPGNPRR